MTKQGIETLIERREAIDRIMNEMSNDGIVITHRKLSNKLKCCYKTIQRTITRDQKFDIYKLNYATITKTST